MSLESAVHTRVSGVDAPRCLFPTAYPQAHSKLLTLHDTIPRTSLNVII
jgi:hypothetical protein